MKRPMVTATRPSSGSPAPVLACVFAALLAVGIAAVTYSRNTEARQQIQLQEYRTQKADEKFIREANQEAQKVQRQADQAIGLCPDCRGRGITKDSAGSRICLTCKGKIK